MNVVFVLYSYSDIHVFFLLHTGGKYVKSYVRYVLVATSQRGTAALAINWTTQEHANVCNAYYVCN